MKLSQIEIYLGKKDPKLKKIIKENGHIVFKPNNKHQFDSLVEIVIAQFISTSAANSIFQKIKDNFSSEYLNEKHFQNLNINEIKNLGLSTNKAKTIKELSNLHLNKNIEDLSNLNNKELNQALLSVFGVGPWSVNMFEIFCMGNLDIFSSKDAGLRRAMNLKRMVQKDSSFSTYDQYAKKWKPYRTIASLHLWKIVD
tara:strand:+ start:685 stop:1278 length:594 start_codon:yes stop_codon:yes gene_type:complete